jgi:outer membrane protein OmpA-like peptidoglycan-associated protein
MKLNKLLHASVIIGAIVAFAGCAKKEEAPGPKPAAPAPAPITPPAQPVAPPATPAAAQQPAASSDPDSPTPLPDKRIAGVGLKRQLSYYYAFNAGLGTIKITAVAKNAPSGATRALAFGLYDVKAEKLCSESHGNTTVDKTVILECKIERAQPLILRLDLGEETIDYSVALEGPVDLPPAQAPAAPVVYAGAGSTDIDAPTRLSTNRIKGAGTGQAASYYYALNAGPGEVTITGDAKNRPAAVADALKVTLYTLRSERLCDISLGNTTLDKRNVVVCKLDKRAPLILRIDLDPETIDYRVKVEGALDFDPFAPPKIVTIALDAAVLFDTGNAVLKPEAKQTLHEAAQRVRKFGGAAVLISGHTDNVGNDKSNQALSENRANAVKAYFVSQEGIAADGLATHGFGKSHPVADNASEAGRARNRRVDVTITPKDK